MIGVFGGTFDPIHYGHLRIALDSVQELKLEQVRFIPCGDPPHRNKPVATALQRLSMVRAAIRGQQKFIADDREIRRGGVSYMVDTLDSLSKDYPDKSFCLMIGTDAFNGLREWHQYKEIFNLANIVIMQRPYLEGKSALNSELYKEIEKRIVDKDQLAHKKNGAVCFVPVTQLEISASRIRTLWNEGKDIQFFLPDEVISIIRQQQIY